MNKKILVLGLISIFLMTSVAGAITTSTQKTDEQNLTVDDKDGLEILNFRHDDGEMDDSYNIQWEDDNVVKLFCVSSEIIANTISADLWIYGKADGQRGSYKKDYLILDPGYPDIEIPIDNIKFIPHELFDEEEFSWKSIKIPCPRLLLTDFTWGLDEYHPRFQIESDTERYKDNLIVGIDKDNDEDKSTWDRHDIWGKMGDHTWECDGELMIYLSITYLDSKSRSVNFPFLQRLFKSAPILEKLLPLFTEVLNIY